MTHRSAGLICWLMLATPSLAQDLRLPGNASETHSEANQVDSYDFAIGPWSAGVVPSKTAEGTVNKTAWRIAAQGITSLQVLRPLRDQLSGAGYEILYECQTQACGGFDFRFALDVLPPPHMQVDLGDFRYLSAAKAGIGGETVVGVLISRTGLAGYVQIVQVGPAGETPAVASTGGASLRAARDPLAADAPDLISDLEQAGRTVLSDLTFETGSARLSQGSYTSLQELADHLAANPDLTLALVGHTDSSGSLDGNIALSKRRAGSVLERLVTDYAVSRQQLEAQGMGYLSPIQNNRTIEGREANRRVEAIITSTQ